MTLDVFFAENTRVAIAFSGGVDSAYLLYEGLRRKADIQPYFIKTAFQPRFEFEDARRLATQLDVTLFVIELDILSLRTVETNPSDRCYHCKHALFDALRKRALSDGYSVIIDGTNASDDADDRPGMRALREMSVRSPLRECGLSKDDIRQRSKAAGLYTWDKPAYACLATRISSGNPITAEILGRVEKAEDILFQLGFSDFRVRVFHNAARIQLPKEQMAKAIKTADIIQSRLKQYFPIVLLDLESR